MAAASALTSVRALLDATSDERGKRGKYARYDDQLKDQIAEHALTSGIGNLFGGDSGGMGSLLGNSLGALLGLPGRATGGSVSPGRGYVVGENGPELFVPSSAGRVERSAGQGETIKRCCCCC